METKVQLLKAGQVVEIEGDYFRAVKIPECWGLRACEACELDSLCRGEVTEVCDALDRPFYDRWLLRLAHRP